MMADDLGHTARVLLTAVGDAAARGLVLAAVMGAVVVLLRRKRAAVRSRAWAMVLYGALALPVLGSLLPSWRWDAPTVPVLVEESRPTSTLSLANGTPASAATSQDSAALAPVVFEEQPFSWAIVAAGIYLAGVFALCLHAGLGWFFTRRLRLSAQAISDADVLTKLNRHSSAAGLRAAPQLVESAHLFVPVTMSVVRPIVALPDDWRDWSEPRLDAVLLHEVAHVVRRDVLTQRLSLFYRALVWCSPVSWWLHGHLSSLADQSCDEAALDAGMDPATYASALLDFFARLQQGPRRAAWHLAMASRADSDAAKRVERILSWKGGPIMTRSKLVLAAIVLLMLPVVVLTASVRVKPDQTATFTVAPATAAPASAGLPTADMAASQSATESSARKLQSQPSGSVAATLSPVVAPDSMGQLFTTLRDPALTLRRERALATQNYSGVVQVLEVKDVPLNPAPDHSMDSVRLGQPAVWIMVDVGDAGPTHYLLAFETADIVTASTLLKGDRVNLSGRLAQFVDHRVGYNNLPDKWLVFSEVVIGRDAAPAVFRATNFPGSSTADLSSAQALYELLVGRAPSINGTGRPNETGSGSVSNGPQLRREPQDDFAKGAYEANARGLVAPKVRTNPKPQYTSEAMRAKVEGSVVVEIIVAADGTVEKARVQPIPDGLSSLSWRPDAIGDGPRGVKELAESAVQTARQWTFEPGTLNGQPVPVRMILALEFRLH